MAAPRSLTVIALILLIWNLIGVAAFISQYTADLSPLARTDPYIARIFAEMPPWAWIAYALAVGTGTLGAILLLLRKTAAVWLFLLSVIAVVIQFGHSFLGTDMLAVKGPSTMAFPIVILAVAVGQLLHARRLKADGTLR